jgi:hypothetical protein
MNEIYKLQSAQNPLLNKRSIHQMSEASPKAPENFQNPEKQSEAAQINEVASQSPSQIFSDTISAGGAVKTRYAGSTTLLMALATVDPLAPSTPIPYSNTSTVVTSTTAPVTTSTSQTV